MSPSAPRTVARVLGEFVARTRYADLPSPEQGRAKERLLDAVTCVLAGRNSPATKLALTLAADRQSGPSSFWLSDSTGSMEDCAFSNSILIHGLLLDDNPVHTACVTVPAALAVGETEGSSGAEILTAIALGYEVMQRLDLGHMAHDILARGFRHSAVHATFAATTTAASLMRLGGEGVKDALALTGALLNPGTMEPMGKTSGSSERFVQMASNARNGVLAARLAKLGFAGSDTAIEGGAGIFGVYAKNPEAPAGLLADLGAVWHLDEMAIKPYPCSGVGTLPIYCAERLMREKPVDHAAVERVEMSIRPWGHMVAVIDQGPFANTEHAMVSSCFAVAATLVYGKYDADILMQALGDPRVDALARRIVASGDAAVVQDPKLARIDVTLADGRVVQASASDLPEALVQPLGWDNMVERFHRLAATVAAETRDRIVAEIAAFETRDSCRDLVAMLRQPRAG